MYKIHNHYKTKILLACSSYASCLKVVPLQMNFWGNILSIFK